MLRIRGAATRKMKCRSMNKMYLNIFFVLIFHFIYLDFSATGGSASGITLHCSDFSFHYLLSYIYYLSYIFKLRPPVYGRLERGDTCIAASGYTSLLLLISYLSYAYGFFHIFIPAASGGDKHPLVSGTINCYPARNI